MSYLHLCKAHVNGYMFFVQNTISINFESDLYNSKNIAL